MTEHPILSLGSQFVGWIKLQIRVPEVIASCWLLTYDSGLAPAEFDSKAEP
jgi:hypothetical protein